MHASRIAPSSDGAAVRAARLSPVRRPKRTLRFRLRTWGVEPAFALALCLLATLAERALGALLDPLRGAAQRAAAAQAREQRAALRLARTLGGLKGVFVKAGQFAALRYDVLPAPLRTALASLQDRAAALPFAGVRACVEEELGAPLEQLFARFDPEPIGTASIAQVHRAVLPGGEEVAVKVQHPWLEDALPADLALVRRLLAVWARFGGGARLDAARLFDEFAAGVREELDFQHEARVAEEIARNLADDSQIVVPRVAPTHSTRRVLCMSFHPAVGVTDRAALARLGVEPGTVLEILARAYAKQVFVDGLFHADPHPGNLFVLDEPDAARRPRVLFVDFGLSKRLGPELRRELRRGIYALLQGDLDAFLAGMDRMGMIAPGAHAALRASVSEMFARLRAGGGGPLALGGSQVLALKDEAKALLERTEGVQLPLDLLLYAKTLSYLFALGAELDPSVDLLKLSVPYLLRFLAERDAGAP